MEIEGLGTPERDAILGLLHDGRTLLHQRLRAAEILLTSGDDRAVPHLLEVAADAESPGAARVNAARVLLRHEDDLGRPVLRALADAQNLSPGQRVAAAELLGRDDPAAVAPLSELAADTGLERPVRAHALELLAGRPDGPGELARIASAAEDDLWLWTSTLRLLATIDIAAVHDFLDRPELVTARHLWLAELLRTHGEEAGSAALYEAATDRQVAPAERASAARRLLARPDAVSSEQLASLVGYRDLPSPFRRTAVQVLCRRTSEDALELIRTMATERDLERPYRAWAAWSLTKAEDTPEPLLVTIAADHEIDDWIRLPALDRVSPDTLRLLVFNRDQPGELRDTALTGLLRRFPPVVAGLLHTLVSGQTTEQDLRGLALRTVLAADTADRTRLLETMADDERVEVSLRSHLRQAATQPPQGPAEAPEESDNEPKPQRTASPPSPAETETLINRVPSALRRARAGDRAALDDLAEFLLSTRPSAADRAEAARILAKAKHVTAEGALRRLVADQSLDDTARAELARHLHDLGDRPAAAAALLAAEPAEGLRVARALAEDSDAPSSDRVRAAMMLIGIDQESSLRSLLPLLTEPDLPPDIRRTALATLRRHGGQAELDALRRMVRDTKATPDQRLAAAQALLPLSAGS